MYKILGADGKVYGPVSLEQIGQWAAQGRVNPQTQVQEEGADKWVPAGQVYEISAVLNAAGFGAPPPTLQSSGALPPGAEQRTGLAITSFVLGIFSLICLGLLVGLPAIICGHIAHNRARREPAQYGGAGFAIAGFVLGYVGFLLWLMILPVMLLPALSHAKGRAQEINCMNNMKVLGLAFKTWSLDNKDQFPFNVSTNAGGTLELCAAGPDGADRNGHLHFMVMSNEISAPKFLVCPADPDTSPAIDFLQLQASNITYQVHSGPNINDTNPMAVLAVCPIHHTVLLADGSVRRGPPPPPPPSVIHLTNSMPRRPPPPQPMRR